jgi:hypothetical protein
MFFVSYVVYVCVNIVLILYLSRWSLHVLLEIMSRVAVVYSVLLFSRCWD